MTEVLSQESPPSQPRKGALAFLRNALDWRDLRHTPYGLAPVLILSAAGFFLTLSTTLFGLALPLVVRELKISVGDIIRYQGLVSGVAILSGLAFGYYGDRHKRVPIFAGSMVAAGGLNALVGRATSVSSFGTPNVTSDAFVSIAETPVNSLLADYYPIRVRGRVFSIRGLLFTAGSTFAPLIIGYMLAGFGWRKSYVIVSGCIALIGILAFVVLREPVRGYMDRVDLGLDDETARVEQERPSFGEAWRTIWAIRTMRRIFLAFIVFDFGLRAYSAVLILVLFTTYGLSTIQIGYVAFTFGVVSLVGVLVGGGLIDVINRRRPGGVLLLLGLALLVGAAGLVGWSLGPPLWGFIAIGVPFYLAFALSTPIFGFTLAQILPPNVRTLGTQLLGVAGVPALLIFVPFVATLAEEHGFQVVLAVAAIPFALSAFMVLGAAPLFDLDTRAAAAANLAAVESRRSRDEGESKLLVCRGVDVGYGGVQVLFGVDFDLVQGEIVALLGTNGAGKSTLLRAISGTQEASSGAIVFDGRDITHMPPHEIAQRGVIHMPGGKGVFPGLSVRDNLMLGTWMSDPAQIAERMPEVLEMFPVLAERADESAGALSGGEQQMVSLAQAFLAKPSLLMIDELSLGLSPAVVGQLLDVVRAIHAQGTTIVVVEQSVNVALSLAERAIFMEKGEVKFVGETADLLRRPDILRAVYVKGTGGAAASPKRARSGGVLEQRQVLEVRDLRKTFGGVIAIDDISFDVAEGQTLGIIGPNGSGKTTLFDVLSGYQTADAGTVVYDGVDISGMSPEERARRKLVRRFQDARLFPSLTVFETLLVALDQRQEVKSVLLTAGGIPQARRSEKRIRVRAERLVELLELGAFRDKFVKELSTGVRRVVDLACVLATEPKLLLLDEPSSGIAQAEAENLAPLLRRVTYETGCTLVIIEHDMPLITAVSDELLALERGRVLMRGLPQDVLDDDRVVESYLGGSQAAVKRSGVLPT